MTPITPVLSRHPGIPCVEFAKEQPQYVTLPALRAPNYTGRVTTRWQLTFRECWRLWWGGELWIQQLTFGEPLQPIKILTEEPELHECL